jgi:hypothetical protein
MEQTRYLHIMCMRLWRLAQSYFNGNIRKVCMPGTYGMLGVIKAF